LLSRVEAEKLTAKIRGNVSEYGRLIKEAKEGKVWIALGYTGFSEWLTEAVGISRTRGYQLLNIALLEDSFRAAISLPVDFTLSDLSARAIGKSEEAAFITQLAEHATDDEYANEILVIKTIAELRKNEVREEVIPLPPIADQSARLAINVVEAFVLHANDLPAVEELDRLALKTSITSLTKAVTAVRATLADYDTAISEGEAITA
jgi:hypothetical protein